jgi:hypothetical protein
MLTRRQSTQFNRVRDSRAGIIQNHVIDTEIGIIDVPTGIPETTTEFYRTGTRLRSGSQQLYSSRKQTPHPVARRGGGAQFISLGTTYCATIGLVLGMEFLEESGYLLSQRVVESRSITRRLESIILALFSKATTKRTNWGSLDFKIY